MYFCLHMRYLWQHISTIIDTYDGSLPLTHFLKAYYKQHPKLGSRDRRMLSEMTYCWYRCSKALPKEYTIEEKVATCVRLCNSENQHLLRFVEGIETIQDIDLSNIFPEYPQLSQGIERDEWLTSMLIQPDLFIRLRKDSDKSLAILDAEEVPYELLDNNCVALPNGIPIDKILPEHAYVVQDASSQAISNFLDPQPRETWWDACAGAGGKSLLLLDLEPLVELTVSDRRRTILNNLKERFRAHSHILPKVHKVDVAEADKLQTKMGDVAFDNIICDVPCSGSGTWARTPEQCYFYKQKSLTELNRLQKNIVVNADKYLKSGGRLYYITCSVFHDENEGIVEAILKETNLEIEDQVLINGTEMMADSMFIAILKKP